jgi:hypothetical protein
MKFFYILIVCCPLIIFNGFAQNNRKYKGYNKILLLYSNHYTEKTAYKILNEDKSLFAEIKSINGNEPSCKKIDGSIFAYNETYFIFHFFAKIDAKDSNYYDVKIGNTYKLMHKDSTALAVPFEGYLKKYYCKVSALNPLRVKPNDNSEKIKIAYDKVFFLCLKINGDWIYIECLECGAKPIKGWTRWRINNSIILDIPYVY